MKAVSLYQPYASLVKIGAKKFETRSWETKHRGPLAIHATKAFPRQYVALSVTAPFFRALRNEFPLPAGAVLCVVDLVDCIPTSEALQQGLISDEERLFGDYGPDRFAWKLQPFDVFERPIHARGGQRIWEWTPPQKFTTYV